MHDSNKITLLFFAFSAETKKLEIIWFSIHDQTLVCGIVIHCHDYMILETKKNIYWESLHCKKEDQLSHHEHFARKTQFYRYVNQNQDSQFCSHWTYYLQKDKRKIKCTHLHWGTSMYYVIKNCHFLTPSPLCDYLIHGCSLVYFWVKFN